MLFAFTPVLYVKTVSFYLIS